MSKTTSLAPETLAAQALHYVDLQTGAVIPPIQPSTTFVRDENYELLAPAHSYGRDENPGYLIVEKLLAELEGARAALLFSSGMAAATSVVQSLKPVRFSVPSRRGCYSVACAHCSCVSGRRAGRL